MVANRWTQYQEDSARLPEGFTRVEYDADTQRYIFKDRNGVLYRGEEGSEYGVMTPIKDEILSFEQERPGAFATSHPRSSPPGYVPLTFQEILPPELITTASLSEHSNSHSCCIQGHRRRQYGHLMGYLVSAIQRCTHYGKYEQVRSHRGFEMLDDADIDEQEGLLRRPFVAIGSNIHQPELVCDFK